MKSFPFLLLPLLSGAAVAQTPSAFLRFGDILPAGELLLSVQVPAVSLDGGYAVTALQGSFGGIESIIWGSLDGGPGETIRVESGLAGFQQTTFEYRFGLAGTSVLYSASVQDASGLGGSFDSLWLDDLPFVLGGTPALVPGEFWTSLSAPGLTQGGTPYFVAGTSPTQGGSTTRRALYFGSTPSALLQSGQNLPGLPFPLAPMAIGTNFAFSVQGTNFIAEVSMDTAVNRNGVVVLNGTGLLLDGRLVREFESVPQAIGGLAGERWDNFDLFGITESGDYFFTGDSDADPGEDEFLLRNGRIDRREGGVIDGFLLEGSPTSAAMNEAGNLAYVWGGQFAGSRSEALFLDDRLLLQVGDPVDWDGDGTLDAGATLVGFTGDSSLALGLDGTLWFTADVNEGGSVQEGYFRLPTEAGSSYCVASVNSTGKAARISASGSELAQDNQVTLLARDLPPSQFGYFVNSLQQGFLPGVGGSQGVLCLAGEIGRYNTQVFDSGPSGFGSLQLDLEFTPTPLGSVAVLAGETWNFQCWYRDVNPGPTSNLTDGLSIDFQ